LTLAIAQLARAIQGNADATGSIPFNRSDDQPTGLKKGIPQKTISLKSSIRD
jgi:hypothetical protein